MGEAICLRCGRLAGEVVAELEASAERLRSGLVFVRSYLTGTRPKGWEFVLGGVDSAMKEAQS